MYINGVGFMTAIDRTIKYKSVEYVESKHASSYLKALSVIANQYNKAGYYVYMLYCDQEFKSLLQDAWEQLEITINYTNTEDHVGEAKRNNRFLKERFRTKFHYLPCKAMPRFMIKGLATQVARQAKFFL